MTPENGKSLVQSYDCLDKVVIVDTAHKVRQEVLSNLKNMVKITSLYLSFDNINAHLWTDAGEHKLEQVQDTRARVSPAKILEYQVRAEISRLQLCPGKCLIYSPSLFIYLIFSLPITVLEVLPYKVTVTQNPEMLQVITFQADSILDSFKKCLCVFCEL
mgnify:CR=1 FL=1